MIPITAYPSIVVNNLKHFEEFFSKPQLEHFVQYLTGLIVSENRTVQGILVKSVGLPPRRLLRRSSFLF